MMLLFIGIDPNSDGNGSPTVWVDRESRDLVLQGWRADEVTEASCAAFTIPGHAQGIPENETVIRIPARMAGMVRKACEIIEQADE